VVFTYNIMMHPKTITPLKVRYEFIEKVEKTGDYTVGARQAPDPERACEVQLQDHPQHGPSNPQYLTREDRFAHSRHRHRRTCSRPLPVTARWCWSRIRIISRGVRTSTSS